MGRFFLLFVSGTTEDATGTNNRKQRNNGPQKQRRSNDRGKQPGATGHPQEQRNGREQHPGTTEQRNNREPQQGTTEKPQEQRSNGATESNNRERRSTHRINGTHGSSSPQTHRPSEQRNNREQHTGSNQKQRPGATGKSQEKRSNRTARGNNREHRSTHRSNGATGSNNPHTHRPTSLLPTNPKRPETEQQRIHNEATWRRCPRIYLRFFFGPLAFSFTRGAVMAKTS